jgi:quercetin dioxygenase-like cupin family protein
MKTPAIVTAVALLALAGFAARVAWPQPDGIQRNVLQQHDLGVPGFEVLQVRIDIAPGATAPEHHHPGEEIVYVIEGQLEYRLAGKPPVTLKAGDVFFIPAGAVHSARNVGQGNAAEIATYVVQKGKPLSTFTR